MRKALIALLAALSAAALAGLASSPAADATGPSRDRNRSFPTTPTTVEGHLGRAPVAGGAEIPRLTFVR